MAVQTRVELIDEFVRLIIDQSLSAKGIAADLARVAQAFLDEADATNKQALGRVPPSRTFVDGVEGRSLDQVKTNSVVTREYDLVIDVLRSIAEALRAVSPVRSGRYQASHTLFADGTEVSLTQDIPVASEYVFLSDVIYAGKIEGGAGRRPLSPQAPKGVYQMTAAKFRGNNSANVQFAWRKPFNGTLIGGRAGNKSDGRVPAIVVTVGR